MHGTYNATFHIFSTSPTRYFQLCTCVHIPIIIKSVTIIQSASPFQVPCCLAVLKIWCLNRAETKTIVSPCANSGVELIHGAFLIVLPYVFLV